MKKAILLCAALLALTGCRSGSTSTDANDSNADFEEAEVIKCATFGPETTPDSIDAALKAAGLPMHIEWDCNGQAWLVPECECLVSRMLSDSIHYIYSVAEIIFNDEPWLCITYTEDVTGRYWQFMGPESECCLLYQTDLISPQAEPYQMASHGVRIHDSEGGCEAIVVRYLESGTFDTIRFIQSVD